MNTTRYHRDILWPRVRRDAWNVLRRHAVHVIGGELLAWGGTTTVSVLSGNPFILSAIYGLAAIGIVALIFMIAVYIYCDIHAVSSLHFEKDDQLQNEQARISRLEAQLLSERSASVVQIELLESQKNEEIAHLRECIAMRLPVFSGKINQVICGSMKGTTQDGVLLTLHISLTNTGAPSIAHEWRSKVQLSDGRSVPGRNILITHCVLHGHSPSPLIIPSVTQDSLPPLVITSDDAIYKRTLQPIPTGGMATGYLAVFFGGLKHDDFDSECKVTLLFYDVTGRGHNIVKIFTAVEIPLEDADVYPT